MSEHALVALASIPILGVAAQWMAARLALPSILLLLLFGFLAGPVVGLLHPDELFREMLFPFVSISVALILYEGGLTLRFAELPGVAGVVRNLVSIGAVVTWIIAAAAAHLIFGLQFGLATLLGAILVVTGPTVIGPLLRHIRPAGPVGPVLKWEGIVIDPIGAVLAVLVFEVIAGGKEHDAAAGVAIAIVKTIVFGGGFGLLAAGVLMLFLKRYWIPDFLQNGFSLMLVVAAFTGANVLQHESGLLAVTVMGVVLANQRWADVRHIVEFKENLRVLLISALFILLAARLEPKDLMAIGWDGLLFLAVLVLVARPLSVWASTIGSKLKFKERLFLSWMAPRGIVAAAVSALFALRLEEAGYPDARLLVPVTFIAIIGTVAVYGLTAPFVAHRLRIADPKPQGVLFVGAHGWVREVAALLKSKGFHVLLVDNNRANINAARMAGLPTYSGSVLAEYALDEINLGGLGRLCATTANDWINTLAVQRFTRIFGAANCFQLPAHGDDDGEKHEHRHLQGRWLFGQDQTHIALGQLKAARYTVKATPLSAEFDMAAFRQLYGDTAVPMFIITESKRLLVVTAEAPPKPQHGQTLVALVDPQRDPPKRKSEPAEPAASQSS